MHAQVGLLLPVRTGQRKITSKPRGHKEDPSCLLDTQTFCRSFLSLNCTVPTDQRISDADSIQNISKRNALGILTSHMSIILFITVSISIPAHILSDYGLNTASLEITSLALLRSLFDREGKAAHPIPFLGTVTVL